jgi:hypothetical protein
VAANLRDCFDAMGGAERASEEDALGAAPQVQPSLGGGVTAGGDICVSVYLRRAVTGHLLARWHRPCTPQKSLGFEHFEATSSATVQKSPNGGGAVCVRPMFDGRDVRQADRMAGQPLEQGVES